MSWQKPARIGVALVGLAAGAAVYFTMGERRAAPPPQPVHYEDPKADPRDHQVRPWIASPAS